MTPEGARREADDPLLPDRIKVKPDTKSMCFTHPKCDLKSFFFFFGVMRHCCFSMQSLLREVHQEGMQVLSLSELPVSENEPGGHFNLHAWLKERDALLATVESLKGLIAHMQTTQVFILFLFFLIRLLPLPSHVFNTFETNHF